MYRIVKMSSGWYAKEVAAPEEFCSMESEVDDFQNFIDSCEIVCFAEDLEDFAEAIDIDVDDIEVM